MLGRKIILEWDGDEILGVREKSLSLNGEPVNVTSDEDNGWQTLLDEAGENNIEVSISGVTKSGRLRSDWLLQTRTKPLTITYPNGDVISGSFFLATYSETGPYNDATTFEATLQSAAAPTYTPYS